MTIIVSLHDAFELQTVHFSNALDHQQLLAVYDFHNSHRDYAAADTVSIVAPETDLSALSLEQLDDVRRRYGILHSSLEFFVLRRSGWLCLAPAARPALA
jgi:hypothetical protein